MTTSNLYDPSERQHAPASNTGALVLLIHQSHDKYERWYYTGRVVNPRTGQHVIISGIRGPANALASPTLTNRLAFIERTGRSVWVVTQLFPFTKAQYDRYPEGYRNKWY